MADAEKKKRSRSELSSVSETNTSLSTTPVKNPKKKPNMQHKQSDPNENAMKDIQKQLKEINDKLANVMTKNDETLKVLIQETIKQMKEELLATVEKRIEILEGKLFDKENENDTLKGDVSKLHKDIEEQKKQNDKLRNELRYSEQKTDEFLNDQEQYSRLNNIRVSGIAEETFPKIIIKQVKTKSGVEEQKEHQSEIQARETSVIENTESKGGTATYAKKVQQDSAEDNTEPKERVPEHAEQTTHIFINKVNAYIPGLNLKPHDIDIRHRIGKKGEKPRSVIVKFTSRLVKDKIMRNRSLLPKTISIMDDLTTQNYQAFQSVKFKKPDMVKSAWIRNGKIFYKNHSDYINQVKYKNYNFWTSAPWPERVNKTKKY